MERSDQRRDNKILRSQHTAIVWLAGRILQTRGILAPKWGATSARSASPTPIYSRALVSVLPLATTPLRRVVPMSRSAETICATIGTSVSCELHRASASSRSTSGSTADAVFIYLLTYLLTDASMSNNQRLFPRDRGLKPWMENWSEKNCFVRFLKNLKTSKVYKILSFFFRFFIYCAI